MLEEKTKKKHKGETEIVCNDIKGANLVQASLISLKAGQTGEDES